MPHSLKSGPHHPDNHRVRPPLAPPIDHPDALAPVIQLDASRRAHPSQEADPPPADMPPTPPSTTTPPSASPATAPAVDPADLARALSVLRHRAGDRGLELPADLGRLLARLEADLVDGPTAVDPTRVVPGLAAEVATMATSAGMVTLDLVPDEADVLGAALGAELTDLRLDALHEVADAVLAVSRAPRASERWGEPRAAAAAEAVVTAAANDLRDAARTHEWLYEHFTDRVWDVPAPLLERGQRFWRVAARARLKRQLRTASRSGRVPGNLAAAAAGIAEARAARQRVAAVGPLLAQHLGLLNRGPLSNADDALRAVRAVRRLQAALGERLAPDRLSRLLLADAFRNEDVFGPAVNLRMALGAWQRDVEGFGGRDAWMMTLLELADWVEECLDLLPELRTGTAAAQAIGADVRTLRDLVDVHLVRQHVAELTAAQDAALRQAALDAVAFTTAQRDRGVGS